MKKPPTAIMPSIAAFVAIVLLSGACSGPIEFETTAVPATETEDTPPGDQGDEDDTLDDELVDDGFGPTLGDHWHAAYGVYICDRFMPPFQSQSDPDGIHSHGDQLIHIHPFNTGVTGPRATLGPFLDAMLVQFDGDTMVLPEGLGSFTNGDGCGGESSAWQVQYFTDVDDTEGETITDDLGSVRFLGDRELFTIAFVPEGTDIPQPPFDGGP